MAIEDFFRHSCNIFRRVLSESDPGYGLPVSGKTASYPAEPSLSGVQCFFSTSGNGSEVPMEAEGRNTFSGANELALPSGTDISQGDKVVDVRFDLSYTAGFPEDIRGQYISVPLYRRTAEEAL